MSLRKKAFSGMIWSSLQQFGNQGIRFGVSIILARLLLPEEFGLIGMIGIFMAIGTELIASGLTSSLIRTDGPDQRDYSTVFFYNLGGSIILYILLFLTAPLIADFFKQPQLVSITRLYSTTFIISGFSAVQLAKIRKEMNFKLETASSLVSTVCSAAVGVLMAYHGYGVMSLVWMSIVGALISTIMLWFSSKWVPSFVFDKKKFAYHYQFGYRMAIAGVINALFNNIYTLIIGKLFSPVQLGYYTRADTLKQFPVSNISSVLNKVTFPIFAEIKNDNERLKKVYKEMMQIVIFMIAPMLVFLGVIADPLFRFLFTDKWLPAAPYFQILCVNGILYPLHSYNLNILLVKGRSDLLLKLEMAKKVILCVVIVVAVPFGIYGLLWGQVIYSVLCFFINSFFSGKMIGYSAQKQLYDISGTVLLSFFVGFLLFYFDVFIVKVISSDFLRILSDLAFGFILFIILSIIFRIEALYNIKKIYNQNFKNRFYKRKDISN